MSLKKIGEYLTTINVNGEEKVSQLQSEDTTYDITEDHTVTVTVNGEQRVNQTITDDASFDLSESFTTDILVNGTQEASYTQSNSSAYDISVSPDPINWKKIHDSSHHNDFSTASNFTKQYDIDFSNGLALIKGWCSKSGHGESTIYIRVDTNNDGTYDTQLVGGNYRSGDRTGSEKLPNNGTGKLDLEFQPVNWQNSHFKVWIADNVDMVQADSGVYYPHINTVSVDGITKS